MQIHQLKPKFNLKNKKRVGRGGKKGTYSGRGGKGQTARAGRKMVPIIRELIKRYPKLKGYRAYRSDNSVIVVNLSKIEEHFQNGDLVNPVVLGEKGIIRSVKYKNPIVKFLGRGPFSRKLVFEKFNFSKTALMAVEKSGSTIKNV